MVETTENGIPQITDSNLSSASIESNNSFNPLYKVRTNICINPIST